LNVLLSSVYKMNSSALPLPLQDGPRQLLRLASVNDKHGVLANNPMLRRMMRLLADLQQYPIHDSVTRQKTLQNWLGQATIPTHFLGFTALLLRQIQVEVNEQVQATDKPVVPYVSDYDGFVLHAFAETVADILWPDRTADTQSQSFTGPAFPGCLKQFVNKPLQLVWGRFIKNYVGNILQHYFETSRIRYNNADLPIELEENLRNHDAAQLAVLAIKEFSATANVEADIQTVLGRLTQIIVSLLH
jgi:hypothetical protein